MGYLIEAKMLKYKNTYLFQRICNACKEEYLFSLEETQYSKVYFCVTCTPDKNVIGELVPSTIGGIRVTSWRNSIAETDKDKASRRQSTKNYARVLVRDHMICQYCYRDGNTIDHIIPLYHGGTNHEWNLVCACQRCNSLASSLLFKDFVSKQQYLQQKIKQ